MIGIIIFIFGVGVEAVNQYRVYEVVQKSSSVQLVLEYTGNQTYWGNQKNAIIKHPVFYLQVHSSSDFYFKIYDHDNKRFEVPTGNQFPSDHQARDTYPLNFSNIMFQYSPNPFTFKIIRRHTKEIIFDSSQGNLILTDRYLQISTIVPTQNIFGLGERFADFKIGLGNWTIMNRDRGQMIDKGNYSGNTYGNYPVVFARQNDGQFYVFQLRNSNAMVVQVNAHATVARKLSYKVIGGILDFRFMIGDKSGQLLVDKFQGLQGGKSAIPPFWSLGFHLCRWGYTNSSLLLNAIQKMQQNQLPLDTIWSDIDYMDQFQDFTINQELFPLDQLKKITAKRHYVPIIDAGIAIGQNQAYKKGKEMGVFLQTAQGKQLVGRVWPGNTTFVDFFNPRASEYWKYFLNVLYQKVNFSGIWLDMNEYANFCNGNCQLSNSTDGFDFSKDLPFNPAGQQNIQDHGLSLNATVYQNYTYSQTHSFMSLLQQQSTYSFLYNKNLIPFIISRANTFGSGKYSFHWTGDNYASFDFLKISLGNNFINNFWGIQMVGPDICGFGGNTTDQLCSRWYQAGTFYPFMRNHNANDSTDQQPYAMGQIVKLTARKSLNLRYSLLKHFFGLFIQGSGKGTIFKPMFLQFNEQKCFQDKFIQSQFLLGRQLMGAPILQQGQTTREVYFPGTNWYDYQTGKYYKKQSTANITNNLNQTLPFFISQGHLVFAQPDPVLKSSELNNQFQIIAGLKYIGQLQGETHRYSAQGAVWSIEDYNNKSKIIFCASYYECKYVISMNYYLNQKAQTLIIKVTAPRSQKTPIKVKSVKLFTQSLGMKKYDLTDVTISQSQTITINLYNQTQ